MAALVACCSCSVAWGNVAYAQPITDAFMTDAPAALNHYSGHTPTGAFDGTNYLVLFEDGGSIEAARLDATGRPLGSEWVHVQPRSSEGDLNYYYPALAYGGGRYLAAWSGSTLAARLIEPDGTLLPSFELGGNGLYPSIAWNGSNFVVVWMDVTDEGRDTMLAIIDVEGNILTRTQVSMTGDTSWPSVAAGDTMSIVAWENAPDSSTGEIHAARVSHDGTVLDPGGVRIAFTDQDRFVHTASSGQSFLVTWNDTTAISGVMGTVIGEDGARTDTVRLNAADSSGRDFNVGFDGEQYAVVWLDDTSSPNTLWGVNVSLAGAATAPIEIPSRELRANDPPHLLWTGERYLLSYVGEGIVGNHLAADLTNLEQDIALSFVAAKQDSAQSCFDGTHYVLSWTEQRGVGPSQTARTEQISQGAQVLDAETLQLGTAGEEYSRDVALACSGQDSSLSLWRDADSETLYALMRRADGSLGDPHTIATGAIAGGNLASNGESYLATFLTSAADGQYAMSAQLLELDGTPRGERFDLRQTGVFVHGSLSALGTGYLWYYDDNENTYLQPISATGELPAPILLDSGRTSVFAASNGTNGIITYGKLNADGETRELVLRFVSQDDWGSADIPLGIEASYATPAWDGTQFVLVTQDEAYRAELHAVSASGELSLQTQFLPEESYVYGLASNGEGQLLLTYLRYVGQEQRSTRIFNRVIGDLVSVDVSDRVAPVPSMQPPVEPEPPTEPPPSQDMPTTSDDAGIPSDDAAETTDQPSPVDSAPPQDDPTMQPTTPDRDQDATQQPDATAPAASTTPPVHSQAPDDSAPSVETSSAEQDNGCSMAPARKSSSSTHAWLAVGLFALVAFARRSR